MQRFKIKTTRVTYLIDDGFESDLQIVPPCQLHGLIDALGSQRVPPKNGVGIPTRQGEECRWIKSEENK